MAEPQRHAPASCSGRREGAHRPHRRWWRPCSLLPRFPGLDAIGQAIAAGADETGVTVHYLDEGVDTGPVIAQQAIAIETTDRDALHDALRPIEHALLTAAVKSFR